jgi:hypothetical protein
MFVCEIPEGARKADSHRRDAENADNGKTAKKEKGVRGRLAQMKAGSRLRMQSLRTRSMVRRTSHNNFLTIWNM